MREKRSEAEKEFGRLLKEAIDNSPEELDFFKQMSKVEVPPPETFMIGPSGFARRRRRIRRALIAGVVAGLVAALFLVGGYLHGKQEKTISQGPAARYEQTQHTTQHIASRLVLEMLR